MAINGKENKNGKDILKLGYECHLSFTLGIKNVCRGKAHLETDNGCAKLHSSKNESCDQAQQEAKEEFGDKQQQKGDRCKADFWDGIGHHRKEGESDGNNHRSLYSTRSLGGRDNRNGTNKPGDPAEDHEKGLKLLNGDKLDIHYFSLSKSGHDIEKAYGKYGDNLDYPGTKNQ